MKKKLAIVLAGLLFLPQIIFAEEIKPVKNVIFMVSDGTSLATISLARWYQNIIAGELTKLHMDPYISGTVITYCSNAPIGDSAPTTSSYMNGMPSIQGMVGTYPYATKHDLIPVDSTMAYRPIVSLMEATSLLQDKKIGLVVTCEFPHATPADATAHSYSRKRYDWIVPQMVHNDIDVVIGGGVSLINKEQQDYLKSQGYQVFTDDYSSLSEFQGDKMWSLFSPRDIPYEIDGVAGKDPKIDEMTTAALKTLDRNNPNGFFLLIEGSKVDWAAHANDPVAMATEMLAFDRAVKVAIDFAIKDGNTAVVLTSDHGNSGISIGRTGLKNYAGASTKEVFGPLTSIKKSSVGLARMISNAPESEIIDLFQSIAGFTPTEEELNVLRLLRKLELAQDSERKSIIDELKAINISGEGALYTSALPDYIAAIYRSKMHLGFTTHGHTGEDTFLATYAPTEAQRLKGVHTNIELHNYLRQLLGIEASMMELTDEFYAPHSEVFSGMDYTITEDEAKNKCLTITQGKKKLTVTNFSSIATLNGEIKQLQLPVVYVDKRGEFYLPRSLRSLLK